MTIRTPVRFALFVLYTAAVLGGAFGISYIVFEWRDDAESDSTITESLNNRIDRLDDQFSSLSSRFGSLSSASSADSAQCHLVLWELTIFEGQIRAGEISGTAFDQKAEELSDRFDASC